ncbi:hypothetical protein N2W54_008164 [Lotmaria passim]
MSASASELSSSEAYALWGERIRCLFAAPPSFIENTVACSPFERHVCAVPFFPSTPCQRNGGKNIPNESSVLYDVSLYPLCFYARLLQSDRRTSVSAATAASDAAVVAGGMHHSVAAEQPSQHLFVYGDHDDELANRLAERLRARNRTEAMQRQRQRDCASSRLVSVFCDPKVEEQQAALHAELTEFLLEVRERNKASAALRRQLQRSRVVRERLHTTELPAPPPFTPCEEEEEEEHA